MGKFLKYITLVQISFLFLISSTGVYLTIHYCNAEDITGLFLFTPLTEEPCEHHKYCSVTENSAGDLQSTGNNSCESPDSGNPGECPSPTSPDCCSDTVLYIFVDDNFVKTNPPEIIVTNFFLCYDFGFNLTRNIAADRNCQQEVNPNPSEKPYGRQLAYFNRQLLL